MAKSRKINNALIRILDQSSSIVYVISDELRIAYANEACASWIGIEPETLVGTNLIYTTEDLEDTAENAAKGLSIAPHLIARPDSGESFPIQIFTRSDEQLHSRMALASAIHDHRGVPGGFFVVGASENQESTDTNVRQSIDTPTALHNALMMVRQTHQKRFNIKSLVGESAAAQRVRRQMRSATDSGGDVLIVGPEGSGREHLARTIYFSQFSDQTESEIDTQLIPLHCSITDPAQVQATMKELLNQRHNATLLLIDVDRMDAGSQQELLGYLQLPGLAARMIATTKRKLESPEVNFDPTLASRLSTLTIELPALADRREDLPLLAQAILESRNSFQAKQFSGFSRQAIEQICEHDWPGNLGQLAATIEEATTNATGSVIEVADFPETFRHSIQAQRFAPKEETKIDLEQYLLGIEEQLINRAVTQAKGNKTKAAELLGISRAKLLRRLQSFQQQDELGEELLDASVFMEETSDED